MDVCVLCRQSIKLNYSGNCHNHDFITHTICDCSTIMELNSGFSFKQFCRDFCYRILTFTSVKWNSGFLVLCLLLINMTVAHSKPHLRHQHYRQLRDLLENEDAICKQPDVLKKYAVENEACIKFPRQKRSVRSEMLLKEGQTSSLCNYRVCVDEDPTRKPVHIHKVFCVQEGCTCKSEGVYRCTQLYDNVEVWYDKKNETLKVEYGCICAVNGGTKGGEIKPTITTNWSDDVEHT